MIPAAIPARTISSTRAPTGRARPSYIGRRSERRGEAAAPPALEMAGVCKSFGAGVLGCSAAVRVLAGASLVVRAGEIVGVAGEAGSGKSTLLLCAAGRVRAEWGSVTWHAMSAGAASAGVHPPLYLDLRDWLQRREVERALEGGVRLLLLDHATAAWLDELRGAIGRASRSRASAIVVAGRSGAELARVASRVLVMRDGHLCAVEAAASRAAPQRKRSAARSRSEFPSALARARIRST